MSPPKKAQKDAIERKLAMLPDRSGVYLFRDDCGQVLYIGKAKRLHLRVRSYFRGRPKGDPRLEQLVEKAHDIDTIVTGNEIEALILEANLIKRHRPHFNIELKDDVAQGTYSNLAVITHSTSEFVLDFIRIMPGVPKAEVKSRVILTPEHAKRLLKALEDNVEKFEKVHGPVKNIEGPSGPAMPMNFGGPTGQA